MKESVLEVENRGLASLVEELWADPSCLLYLLIGRNYVVVCYVDVEVGEWCVGQGNWRRAGGCRAELVMESWRVI